MWTLEDYQDRVLLLAADQSPTPVDIMVWVNQCLHELQRDARLEASSTIQLLADIAQYTLPTDLYQIKHLYSPITGYPVKPLDHFEVGGPGFGGQGYRLWEGALLMQPTPTASESLRLEYYKRVNQLVNATDTPTIPEEWHDLPYLYAALRAKQQDAEFAEGAQFQFEYQQRRDAFTAQRNKHARTAFRRVRTIGPWE